MGKEPFDKAAHQDDTLDLLRKVLDGVQLQDMDLFIKNLDPNARRSFLKYCSEVVGNDFFPQVFSILYYPQVMAAATKAANYDEVTFHRATANGISLVKEFFEKQNKRYQEEFEKDKEGSGFEPEKPFEETDADTFFKV